MHEPYWARVEECPESIECVYCFRCALAWHEYQKACEQRREAPKQALNTFGSSPHPYFSHAALLELDTPSFMQPHRHLTTLYQVQIKLFVASLLMSRITIFSVMLSLSLELFARVLKQVISAFLQWRLLMKAMAAWKTYLRYWRSRKGLYHRVSCNSHFLVTAT